MVEKMSSQKPPKVKLLGIDPERSSAVVEKIMSIGRSTLTCDPIKLHSRENCQIGLWSDSNMIPKGKVNTIFQGISSIAPILCGGSNKENQVASSSDESDIDGFLEYAREKIQENNISYDSASYQDFESLVAESVRNHFIDDDDDQDSMTSASSFSGYDHDGSTKNLEENSLISERSYRRLRGTVAVKKKSKHEKEQREDEDACLEENSLISDTPHHRQRGTRTSEKLSVQEKVQREDEISGSTRSKKKNADKAVKSGHNSDESTVMTCNSILVGGKNRGREIEPQSLKKYDIDPDDNSLISHTPYRPRRRRKQRGKRTRTKRDVNKSILTEEGWGHVEHTIDDLAFILAQESSREGRLSNLLSANNKDQVLADFKEQSPSLYSAVLGRISENRESQPDSLLADVDQNNTSRNEANASGSSPTLHRSQNLERSYKIYLCGTPDKTYEADKSQGNDLHEQDLCTSRTSRKCEVHEDFLNSVSQDTSYHDRLFSSMSSPDIAGSRCKASNQDTSPVHTSPSDQGGMDYWDEDTVPDISIDSQSLPFPTIDCELATILESSNIVDGVDLDEMIDHFLTGKVERLTRRTHERQVILARKQRVLEQIRQRRENNAEMVQYFTSSGHPQKYRLERFEEVCSTNPTSESNGRSHGAPLQRDDLTRENQEEFDQKFMCQRSRALIRKVQSKRKALALAKQLERSGHTFTEKLSTGREDPSRSTSHTNPHTSSLKAVNVPASQKDDVGNFHEIELENFLSLGSPESPYSSLEDKRKRIMKLKAKRTRIMKSQYRGRVLCEKPLHESWDDPVDESHEITEAGFKTENSPTSGSVIKRFTRKRVNSYEALSENDRSFVAENLKSDEILQAFAPPSPESPIGDYRLSEFTDSENPDVMPIPSSEGESFNYTDYFEASSENSGESLKRETKQSAQVMFISTGTHSRKDKHTSSQLHIDTSLGLSEQDDDGFSDSFDGIVRRHAPSNDTAQEDQKPLFIVRKVSPTSVEDFFAAYEPSKSQRVAYEPSKSQRVAYEASKSQRETDTLAFVDDEERDPVFVDEDDQFINNSFQDNGTGLDFVEAEFISSSRFEV